MQNKLSETIQSELKTAQKQAIEMFGKLPYVWGIGIGRNDNDEFCILMNVDENASDAELQAIPEAIGTVPIQLRKISPIRNELL